MAIGIAENVDCEVLHMKPKRATHPFVQRKTHSAVPAHYKVIVKLMISLFLILGKHRVTNPSRMFRSDRCPAGKTPLNDLRKWDEHPTPNMWVYSLNHFINMSIWRKCFAHELNRQTRLCGDFTIRIYFHLIQTSQKDQQAAPWITMSWWSGGDSF